MAGARVLCAVWFVLIMGWERTIDKKKKITVDDYMLQDPNPRLISGQQAVRTRGQSRRSGFPSFPSHPRPLIWFSRVSSIHCTTPPVSLRHLLCRSICTTRTSPVVIPPLCLCLSDYFWPDGGDDIVDLVWLLSAACFILYSTHFSRKSRVKRRTHSQ